MLLLAAAFSFVTFPLAIATAATIRVGNTLGAGLPHTSRLAAKLCLAATLLAMSLMAMVLLAKRTTLGSVFSDDPRVIEKVAAVMPIIAAFQISDGFQGTAAGILRAIGRHRAVAVANFAGFWVIGLPLCYTLAFPFKMGLRGIWYGHLFGITACAIVHSFFFLRIDWVREAEIAVINSAPAPKGADEEVTLGQLSAKDAADVECGLPSADEQPALGEGGERNAEAMTSAAARDARTASMEEVSLEMSDPKGSHPHPKKLPPAPAAAAGSGTNRVKIAKEGVYGHLGSGDEEDDNELL